jgi:hypothetical protein
MVLIDRPIMDVYQYFSNPDRLREWVPFYGAVDVPAGYRQAKEPKSFGVTVGMAPWGFKDTVTIVDAVMGRSLTYRSERWRRARHLSLRAHLQGDGGHRHAHALGRGRLHPLPQLRAAPGTSTSSTRPCFSSSSDSRPSGYRPSPPMIFFSYRRKEDRYTGGADLRDARARVRRGSVFRDIDSMSSGDFDEQIVRPSRTVRSWSSLVAPAGSAALPARRKPARPTT